MTSAPETRYAVHRGSQIAYQVLGSGPTDLVLVRLAMNNLEIQWEEPRFSGFLTRLSSFSRLIVFDARGLGLSDPLGEHKIPTMDDWSDDIIGVMDAVGSERAAIVTCGASSLRGIPFVATHPDRVNSLVLVDGTARIAFAPDYPHGRPPEAWRKVAQWANDAWGRSPQPFSHEEELLSGAQMAWLNRYRRLSTSPGMAALIFTTAGELDVRHILEVVTVPTLVIDHETSAPFGRYLASHITGAERVEIPGKSIHGWPYTDPGAVADEIERFVTGATGSGDLDRLLATVLFTDIVDSTRQVSSLGDSRWKSVLDAFDTMVASEIGRFRGRVVKSTGDGHLATFDAPGRAIRCACALRDAVSRLDLQLRAGLHTGEIEIRGDDIGGVAVNIGRRVCDLAGAGEVLTSGAVPPLVAGSGLEFEDRGEHELKGVPGHWQLFAVNS